MMHLLNFVILALAAAHSYAAPIDPASSVEIVTASGPIGGAVTASGAPSTSFFVPSIGHVTRVATRPAVPTSSVSIVSASGPIGGAVAASGVPTSAPLPSVSVTSTRLRAVGAATSVAPKPVTSAMASASPMVMHARQDAQPVRESGRIPTTAIVGNAVEGVLDGVPVLGARQIITSSVLSAPTTVAVPSAPCPMSDAEGVTTLAPRHIMTDWPPRPSASALPSLSPLPSVSPVPSAVVPRDVTGALPTMPAAVPLPPLNRVAVPVSNLDFEQVGPITPKGPQPPSITTQIRV